MSQLQPETPLSHEVRFRVPLPIVIPIGALLLIAAITIGMSRILLSVPKEISVVIALAVAANVLIACAFIALRPESARSSWAELAIVALYPLIIGVVIAQMGLGSGHTAEGTSAGEGEHGGAAAPAEGAAGGNVVTAANVAFDTDTIELESGGEATIEFVNDDAASVPHNIAIYEDDSAEQEIFVGDQIPGGQETTYTFEAPKPGDYYFQCDVHPAMNGTVTVK
ncbi:MAG TPA: cupredoxin domain-containing protein [Actinomycetota bacterium]|nr:cupredoxin domain-containing protein [Actinomycetota bacterium]